MRSNHPRSRAFADPCAGPDPCDPCRRFCRGRYRDRDRSASPGSRKENARISNCDTDWDDSALCMYRSDPLDRSLSRLDVIQSDELRVRRCPLRSLLRGCRGSFGIVVGEATGVEGAVECVRWWHGQGIADRRLHAGIVLERRGECRCCVVRWRAQWNRRGRTGMTRDQTTRGVMEHGGGVLMRESGPAVCEGRPRLAWCRTAGFKARRGAADGESKRGQKAIRGRGENETSTVSQTVDVS
jgi:hypothetical protein